jgi:hypothetical protein
MPVSNSLLLIYWIAHGTLQKTIFGLLLLPSFSRALLAVLPLTGVRLLVLAGLSALPTFVVRRIAMLLLTDVG